MPSFRLALFGTLIAAVGCSQDPVLPAVGSAVLLGYTAEPTTAQVEAAAELSRSGVVVIRTARTIAIRADAETAASSLRALPGVVKVTELGVDADPRVSAVIAFDAPPTASQVRFVEGLGGDAVYPLTEWSMVTAVRVPLSRVIRLDQLEGVTSVEIQLPGSGPGLAP